MSDSRTKKAAQLEELGHRQGTLSIHLPIVTPSLNQWQRWHWRKREKWRRSAILLIKHGLSLDRRTRDPSKRIVEITRYSSGTLDHDNLVGGCKSLIDVLVTIQLLVDDSPQWLQCEYRQEKCKRGEGHMEIEIKEAD